MTRTVDLLRATAVPYEAGLAWQRATAERVRDGGRDGGREALALLEHQSVYTMGRRGGRTSMLLPAEAMPAPVVDIERGGDITWHGPGQLVGYPILDLRARGLRAADYVRALELTLIDALATLGVEASTVAGRPGVWVAGAKVAAIGVAIRGGVSMHGFALNVSCDLAWFDAIVPCGIADASVTSLARLLPTPPSIEDVATAVGASFERQFDTSLSLAVDADVADSMLSETAVRA